MSSIRVGLVLGAGGLAGTAFHAGVLAALADELGWDARSAEVIVGTSAGSTSAALLRGDLSPTDYFARITGTAMSPQGRALLGRLAALSQPPPRRGRGASGSPSGRRRLGPASAPLLRRAVLRPGSVHPGAILAAALPAGVVPNADVGNAIAPLHGERWPARDLWICTVRLDTGARVVFGRDADAPPAPVHEAVAASCAIPGYYEPSLIDDVQYVDGGMRSVCNLDLVAGGDLDLVIVSAPMSASAWASRSWDSGWRATAKAQLGWEARKVRRRGTPVVLIQPGEAARAAMSGASMDVRRRPAIAREVRSSALAELDDGSRALLQRLR
jgi:NTE family protein